MSNSRRLTRAPLTLLLSLLLVATVLPATAGVAAPGQTGCHPQRGCDEPDQTNGTAPSGLTIAGPAEGDVLTGSVTARGVVPVAANRVDVTVGTISAAATISGDTWQARLSSDGLQPGTYELRANARGPRGFRASASVSVIVEATVADPESEPTLEPEPEPEPEPITDDTGSHDVQHTVLTDPSDGGRLRHMGAGRVANVGDHTAILTNHSLWLRPRLSLVAPSGNVSHVDLPNDGAGAWSPSAYAVDASNRLHMLSGQGPLMYRRYQLHGSPPTSATLVQARQLGDGDSRVDDLIVLDSGAVLGAWHQQGATGPQGSRVAHVRPNGTVQTLEFYFMPTRASGASLAQHPATGDVWLFANADASSAIGTAVLRESSTGITLASTNGSWITNLSGESAPDPENPSLVAAPDPANRQIVITYQSRTRTRIDDGSTYGKIGSYPAVTRVAGNGSYSTTLLPVWVERVSNLGLAVTSDGAVWVSHRRFAADGTFNHGWVSRLQGGKWSHTELGTLAHQYEPLPSAQHRPHVATRLSDGQLRLLRAG